jgi:hypothetical protein
MNKPILTLTALSLLAGGNLIAQTTATNPNVEAWRELKRELGDNFNPVSPEVAAIKDAILQQPAITREEAWILRSYFAKLGGADAWLQTARTIADKCPLAAAAVKWADKDPTGWTPEMISDGRQYAVAAAMFSDAPQDLKDQNWVLVSNEAASAGGNKRFFKAYRATLPKREQLVATQKQKDILIAKPTRSEADNAWLAEVSADLIALQLDQKP